MSNAFQVEFTTEFVDNASDRDIAELVRDTRAGLFNKEAFLKVADLIEQHEDQFNMSSYCRPQWDEDGRPCGNIRCIGGWASTLHPEYEPGEEGEEGAWLGHQVLGITPNQGADLFYVTGKVWEDAAAHYGWETTDSGYGVVQVADWNDIKAYQAANLLRRIAWGRVEL